MFTDARELDRQHTASSFEKAMQRYAEAQESWFDGSVGSIDTRLAACNRLLATVRATVARMGITDSHRYLTAGEELRADQAVLSDLRQALLTGGSQREACSDFDSDHHPTVPKTKLDKKQKLAGTDRRWVILEAASFIAAHATTCDDLQELAIRAQHHAAVKTSTFTPERSAAICAAFVDEVGELGRQKYRPVPTVHTAAQEQDWDTQAMYLC